MYNESLKTDQSKSNISSPSYGEDSSNIALISQKSNPELLNEEQSLDLLEGDLTVSNLEHDGNLSLDFLRDARVDHFQRNSQIPIRDRHSIGSPCLLQSTNTNTSTSSSGFGDEEVERFFKKYTQEINSEKTKEKEETLNYREFVKEVFHWYSSKFNEDTIRRNVIIQRDPDRFWKILLKQRFDFSTNKIALTFTGEAGADAGGFLRKFLTLSMKYFGKCPDSFLGSESSLLFKSTPKSIEENK